MGVAEEDQPHYLKVMARPGVDLAPVVAFGLGVIAARAERMTRPPPAAASSPRCGPTNHRSTTTRGGRLRDLANVTLLMKETLVRVAEPALVPAGVR